jgi:hypothetical protein
MEVLLPVLHEALSALQVQIGTDIEQCRDAKWRGQQGGAAADVVPLPCLLAWAAPVCPLPTAGKYPQN